MAHYGERIQALIQNRGTTQKKVGEAVGMSESAMSHLVKKKRPAFSAIEKICEYLNEPLSRFFSEPGDPGGLDAEIMRELSNYSEERKRALLQFLRTGK